MSTEEKSNVTVVSYILLLVAIIMFSGIIPEMFSKESPWYWLYIFDFNTLNGAYGKIASAGDFRGVGGAGAREGFLFALNLCPSVILALGIVKIVDGYGGLLAAERILRPLFRPLLGLPGITGLACLTHLQSTDGGAAMTKELFDNGHITDEERTIFTTLQLSGDGTITNYFATVMGALSSFMIVPLGLPLLIIFLCKVLGTNLMRMLLKATRGKNASATA